MHGTATHRRRSSNNDESTEADQLISIQHVVWALTATKVKSFVLNWITVFDWGITFRMVMTQVPEPRWHFRDVSFLVLNLEPDAPSEKHCYTQTAFIGLLMLQKFMEDSCMLFGNIWQVICPCVHASFIFPHLSKLFKSELNHGLDTQSLIPSYKSGQRSWHIQLFAVEDLMHSSDICVGDKFTTRTALTYRECKVTNIKAQSEKKSLERNTAVCLISAAVLWTNAHKHTGNSWCNSDDYTLWQNDWLNTVSHTQ